MMRTIIHFIRNLEATLLTAFFLFALSDLANAQADRKYIRQGNKEFSRENYSESEISYRKALDKNKESADAVFNTGDALYKQKKYEEAGKQFLENNDMNESKIKKSASLYNLGNSMLMANKVKESIEAYENSLRLNPKNMEAKYNLAYAQDLLRKEQQQQQQQQQQQNDKNKDKDKKDQNRDQQNDQNKQNQQQDQKNNQQQPPKISKEDAERLLNSLQNDEKKVQEKVKLAKAQREKERTVINW